MFLFLSLFFLQQCNEDRMPCYLDVLFVGFKCCRFLLLAAASCQLPQPSSTRMENALNIDQSNMGSRNWCEISVLMHDCRFLLFFRDVTKTQTKRHLNNFPQWNESLALAALRTHGDNWDFKIIADVLDVKAHMRRVNGLQAFFLPILRNLFLRLIDGTSELIHNGQC